MKIFKKTIKREQELKEAKEKIRDLEDRLDDKVREYVDRTSSLETELKAEKSENAKLAKKNEELQMKIDILFNYYGLNREVTEEGVAQLRRDKRVHELEMENMELRLQLANYRDSMIRDLDRNIRALSAQCAYPTPYPIPMICNSVR